MKVCKSKLCLSKVYYLSWRKYNFCQWCEFIVSSRTVVIRDSSGYRRFWFFFYGCHRNETINETKIFNVRSGHSKSCKKRLKPFLNWIGIIIRHWPRRVVASSTWNVPAPFRRPGPFQHRRSGHLRGTTCYSLRLPVSNRQCYSLLVRLVSVVK